MKRILVLSVIALLTSVSWGRDWRTPFEKVERNEAGKRVYKFENPSLSRSSLSVSYGFMPVESFGWYTGGIYQSQDLHLEKQTNLTSKNTSNIGAISLAYANQLTPWLELQIPLTYTYSTGYFTNAPSTMTFNSYHEFSFSMMPNVKISWLYSDQFRFYSRVGVGFAIGNRYEEFNAGMNSKFAASWQVSPIGIEVGKSVRFFAEAGFGTQGVIQAGIKFHFRSEDNNSDGTPRQKSGETFNWYERRLQ